MNSHDQLSARELKTALEQMEDPLEDRSAFTFAGVSHRILPAPQYGFREMVQPGEHRG